VRRRSLRLSSLAAAAFGLIGVFAAGTPAPPPIRFREVARDAGISFVLENNPTERKHLIETMPGGIAVLDYDGDGRPDIYFTNGAAIPSLEKSSPKYWNRLYRNEGGMKFRDVTEEAGVAGAGYSMGAAAADFDNDGRTDLFLAGVNRNILYRNLGNGKFEDVTAKAGITSGEWAVAAGWFDYDRDGKLDLWVVHYAKWSTDYDRYCGDASKGLRIYCHPKYFEGLASTLYRNRGDGTFEDVSARAGVAAQKGRGMSVAFADYDRDGWPDAFVTNDNMPNFLFHNRGDGTFEEVALSAGVALRDHGKPVASMGVEFKDYDNDGLPDLFVTALAGETFPVFRNVGKGNFADATHQTRIGGLSIKHSGWGLGVFDFNNDGWKDLFTANSHVNDRVELTDAAVYREKNSVFVNSGGSFADVSDEAGLSLVKAHRGAAFADFNGDGRIDAVVSALGEPAELWENTSSAQHWLDLKLTGVKSNRDGLGARIQVAGQTAEVTSAAGYASSICAPTHIGLGARSGPIRVDIRWPDGASQVVNVTAVDRVVEVRQQ
jgi:hypothetical protein